ncbi:hypothetical protein SAMN04488564_102403 [Lentzea waywayandensis]|uniref:Uncharacterized protein n=1 Tax=Lentzea waywayandensis TaxID=84724 RepID=A0A1I6DEY3_9PSEU|nr:hypothetical protein [Lentzea waywayandensis]SFR03862.1 hypothetical protein SAMN04488564_102403 [Lentzea waywayandensis]
MIVPIRLDVTVQPSVNKAATLASDVTFDINNAGHELSAHATAATFVGR